MTYIFGTGGNASAIYSLMLDLRIKISGFIVDESLDRQFQNLPVISTQSVIDEGKRISCVVSVGENYSREVVVRKLEKELKDRVNFPNLVHETAYVSSLATLGKGVVIFPGARVGSNSKIENFVHLNTNSSVDHDSIIAEFSSLAPAAVTGGNVQVGKRTAVLLNSAISNGVSIGDDVVLAAMSFLRDNTGHCELWAGCPATLKGKRKATDRYL
jgi:sugar O-acyltransferase (sialic acid O-acetyltransferase NeuD family)